MNFKNLLQWATFFLSNKQEFFFLKRLCALFLVVSVLTAVSTVSTIGQNQPAKAEIRQNNRSGDWVADFNNDNFDKIEITFVRPSSGVPNAIGTLFSLGELRGLTPIKSNAEKTKVNFTAERDAGTFTFEGYLERGRGTDSWTFALSKDFVSEMRSHGYDDLSDADLLKAAIYHVTVKFVEDLKSFGYDRLSFQELLRARANNIDSEYIKEVKEMGFTRQPFDTLIWMRNHDITRKYINELKAQGYTNLTLKKLVELREQGK